MDLRGYCGDLYRWGWGKIIPRDKEQGWGRGTNLVAEQGVGKHPPHILYPVEIPSW
jgi:hypothetical protein